MTNKIKLLIVDDSVFMRQALAKIFTEPDIEIVGLARNGKEAVDMAANLSPDVITMDIEMPVMNGLEALGEIMKSNPIPVIMVSSLTTDGANATLEALELGAVDFIAKKGNYTEMATIKAELLNKVRNIARNSELRNRLHRRRLLQKFHQSSKDKVQVELEPKEPTIDRDFVTIRHRPSPSEIDVVGIAISTGGPASLQKVFENLCPDLPFPILIVQHMPPVFTQSLANRLNSISPLTVKEAENNETLQNGFAYIAPGGLQMTVSRYGKIVISQEPQTTFKPSADVMFDSLANVFGKKVVGLIMTGMGSDGTEGLKQVSSKGGYVIAQSPDSCVIASMPNSVINHKIANEVVHLDNIPRVICELGGKVK
ncbi:MAG: chemotaxis response regulator protein-glutamate methylesterase [Ignavibacteria bacterium]|nr:chemotaxis response regulator protein-glutamate methylesterase [Ignavibacteria bacterium]